MKKAIATVLCVILVSVLALPAMAEEQGVLGRLTKLNVDEVTLTEAITESYFDLVPFTGYQFYDSLNSMTAALASGAITGMALDAYTAEYVVSRTEEFAIYPSPETVPTYNLGFGMLLREEDAELCEAISEAIASMEADGTLEAMKKTYVEDVIAGNEPEAVVPERFDGAETFTVALTGDRPPMDYFSEAGEAMGFNTALVSEIGRRLGLNVEFISVDSGARAVSLASGACDAVFWMEAGDYGNWENADVEDQPENTVATVPYLKAAYTIVVSASSPLAK